MSLRKVALEDRYDATSGSVLLTGTQALVRLLVMQRRSDAAAGLRTAGFVSGYRGSPLGSFDRELWRARAQLDSNDIRFRPGVNEDLAATAIWGTQQVGLFPGAQCDGVFSLWYGKGPGVDRSGDVFKHANQAGTARHGGVIAAFGDDHAAESSTLAHQSEHALVAAMMPILNPCDVTDLLALGLCGWALSRYAGLWVGLKCTGETIGTTSSVDLEALATQFALPTDVAAPPGGVHIRSGHAPLESEQRLVRHKLPMALAFARANRLDTVRIAGARRRIGIVTAGKAYGDVRNALEQLGIDEARAAELGIGLYKVALTWPVEPEGLRSFAAGFEELLFVEEKRALIEDQAARLLYHLPRELRPLIVGKADETGAPLLPADGTLSATLIARVLASRLASRALATADMRARLDRLEAAASLASARQSLLVRQPYFCSGCPHNRSTLVPEGSRAMAGIGCSYMAMWMDRETLSSVHMGAEGANWNGIAPFSSTPHVFQNIGDGTYFHSGLLAIRAAVAAGVNITYKILYNDAVAMTGGQPVDGALSVPQVVRQVLAESVSAVAIVTDDESKYRGADLAAGVSVHPRTQLEAVQRTLRATAGTTVLVYDQMCAAERRRQRKRDAHPDPPRRVFINSAVCEGCGDCSVKSNCVSILPLETPLGRKRRIDQFSCNKDFSCSEGFCPSFVTVHGTKLRKPAIGEGVHAALQLLPVAPLAPAETQLNILITGIGGTGVVTLGAILSMAAHLEGRRVSVSDVTGLAQKNGAVFSHVKIAPRGAALWGARIGAGEADVLLACDLVATATPQVLQTVAPGRTRVLVNDQVAPTGEFQRDGDMDLDADGLRELIVAAAGEDKVIGIDASTLATEAAGDPSATNLLMLGFAAQRGLLPVSEAAIVRAIELNGAAVERNILAFRLGRLAGHDPQALRSRDQQRAESPRTLDQLVTFGNAHLRAYQNESYARTYTDFIAEVRAQEQARVPGKDDLARAVAVSLLKLMAYKDEYEVARLHASEEFRRELMREFDGPLQLTYHLAPPMFGSRKIELGAWMSWVFRGLAALKGLRGTPFDPFGYTLERRMERALVPHYRRSIRRLLAGLDAERYSLALAIAHLPQRIRGFGHVKRAALERVRSEEDRLWSSFDGAGPTGAGHDDPGHGYDTP